MKRNMKHLLVAAGCGGLASLSCLAARVEFKNCPKCDKRIKIDRAADKAFVNESQLDGADRAAISARAERLLDMARRSPARNPKLRPLMGWSSWNTFGCNISEKLILEIAQAMATNGLKDAGYLYVNIDDGFFWGHGPDGMLRFHPTRFPRGMRPVVDGIHALGLKAGTYSDAGADTCGSMWGGGVDGKDKGGLGAGLYGHDAADCWLHFNELGFDFIKVDYCGANEPLMLDERVRYTQIAEAIRKTGRTDVRLNLCRWAFPGTWAADIAESWRTTGDIRASWKSVRDIVAENLYLSAYASPGHFNDMDMLEVGNRAGETKTAFGKHGDTGLTEDEETTHFGLWCMMSSPLLIGCDVRTIPEFTRKLITNPYLIAMNQNDLGLQAEVVWRDGSAYVLAKDADTRFGTSRYVALYNSGDREFAFDVSAKALCLEGKIDAFDLVEEADVGSFTDTVTVKVAPHATKFYRFDAERRIARTVYEAESAYLSAYQELRPAETAGTAYPCDMAGASGGVAVKNLGNSAFNDLVWRDVEIPADGMYEFTFRCSSKEKAAFNVSIDCGRVEKLEFAGANGAWGNVKMTRQMTRGVHNVRLVSKYAIMPNIDKMTLVQLPAAK